MGTGIKLLTYFTKRLTTITLIIIILFMITFIAYDCANIYVILEEGMDMRAETVLTGEEAPLLDKFFTQSFIGSDKLLNSDMYEDFIISEYDYKIKVKKVWAWPWSRRAKATIQEIVFDISGEFSPQEDVEDTDDEEETPSVPIPEWENGEKIVELRKMNHRWIIDKVTMERSLEKFD